MKNKVTRMEILAGFTLGSYVAAAGAFLTWDPFKLLTRFPWLPTAAMSGLVLFGLFLLDQESKT